jgi:hypothetical protein
MNTAQLRTSLAVIAIAALPALSACVNVSSLDCNEIAQKAKDISQNQPIKIQNITNVRETSRTDSDARCTGDATLADGGTAPVYLRAYEENGNTMVAYQGTPFP